MKSWSELARGLQISLLPDHRRELVKPRDHSPVTTNPFKTSAILSPDAQTIKNSGEPKRSELAEPLKKLQPKITQKIVEFTGDDIAKLRHQGLEYHDTTLQLSRADCLSTHLWRTLTRARNLQPGAAPAIRLCILVEGRKKLSLPPGYFGNVINLLCVITTVSELVNGPFGSTANLIHSAIASTTAEWFQDLVDFMPQFLEPGENKDLSMDDPKFPGMISMGISYLNRFPFYELHFGFGVPAHSTRNTMGARDGLFFVLPSSHGPDHMAVVANMDSDVMHNFFLAMVHDIPK